MKIGVSSYSFSRLVNSGQMEQIAVIAKAKEIGFDVIEFSAIAVPDGKALPDFAAELRDEAERVGIEIVNYTIGADFLKGSGGDLHAEIDRVKREVDVAEILGVPGMRHDAVQRLACRSCRSQELCSGLAPAGGWLPFGHKICCEEGHQDHGREPRLLLPGERAR